MTIGPRLEFRQSQTLVMTPQLRQAIKLLQFSNLEAAAFVEEELERNPLLERDEQEEGPAEFPDPVQPETPLSDDADCAEHAEAATLPDESSAPLDANDGLDRFDGFGAGDGGRTASLSDEDWSSAEAVQAGPNLREHLSEQLRLSFGSPSVRMIGAALIALLDPSGRLSAAPEDVAHALGVPLSEVEAIRAKMMRFDPCGMFARSLAECLGVQLAERNRLDPAMSALLAHLDLLARREWRQLMTICEVDWDDLQDMVAEIRALDPKPGAGWGEAAMAPVVPDVLMRRLAGGDIILELNPDTLPRLLVNNSFYARVAPRANKDERVFLSEKLAAANWLVKSLQQRAHTILKVASEIVQRQDGFLQHGISHLRPLILRDIAEAVGLHESTVSRVTSNKFIATPRGNFELKYFFTNAIAGSSGETHSAESVRYRIRALVGAETVDDILSDDAIVAALRKEGVDIARRTVAKYREALRIPSSVQRKREKSAPL